jgi:hypothetical protein
MKIKLYKILLLGVLFSNGILFSQNSATNSGGKVVTTQPKIMVVPYTEENEDPRKLLEGDENILFIIAEIKRAFDSKGFTTVDFIGKLRAANSTSAISSKSNVQKNYMTEVVSSSGADIKVEVKTSIYQSSGGNKVRLVLQALEVSSGNSLANETAESQLNYSNDFVKLASKALETKIENFLSVMQLKFNEIVENGKSIVININVSENSKINLSTQMKGLPLSDLIEVWMEENAYKNNYHIQGTEDFSMIFDDIRIPLKDQSTGKNYNPNKFALSFFNYLQSVGVNCSKTGSSNNINIIIN